MKKPSKTNLQYIIDDLGLSQVELCLLADIEKYQASNLASGKKPDCYMSTAKKICRAISKIAKCTITLDDVFGDRPLLDSFRQKLRNQKIKSLK